VERRPREAEAAYAGASDERAEHLLGVAAARHPELLELAEVANLFDSRDALRAEISSQEEMLFSDDQQAQRQRDLRAMEDRLANLDEEERREIAAIGERYAEVKPHVSAAAIVFSLTPADAETGRVS